MENTVFRFTGAVDTYVKDQDDGLVLGENNAPAHRSSGEYGLDLFEKGVRNIPNDSLDALAKNLINSVHTPEDCANLFVLLFLSRDCRGKGVGKGEKHLFDRYFFILYDFYPNTILSLLPLIPKYGAFTDILRLLQAIPPISESASAPAPISDSKPSTRTKKKKHVAKGPIKQGSRVSNEARNDLRKLTYRNDMCSPTYYNNLRHALINLYKDQLLQDKRKLEEYIQINDNSKRCKLSFAGKYAPRSDKHFSSGENRWMKQTLQTSLFNNDIKASEKYRKLITSLSKVLDVPETHMHQGEYHQINFQHVPSQCLKRNCQAFLNEISGKTLTEEEEMTGNRYPADTDRVTCRHHLETHMFEGKVQGKQLAPHELVASFMQSVPSRLMKQLYIQQWKTLRDSVLQNLSSGGDASGRGALNLGRVVPMSDVSGSMGGTPMQVSIALGILISEVNHAAFRNRVLTFDSSPSWVSFNEEEDLYSKVKTLQHAPWGGSTNILAAFQLILNVVESANLTEEEVPDMLILSDMQFDAADSQCREADNKPTLQLIKDMFHDYGMRAHGKPFAPPKIIFWNLRGDTIGVPAKADEENVQMLSGFSVSMLKCLLFEGELTDLDDDNNETKNRKERKAITPIETYRKALAESAYDAVREVLSSVSEGLLSEYTFTATATATATAAVPTTTQSHRRDDAEMTEGGRDRGREEEEEEEDFVVVDASHEIKQDMEES